MSDLALKVINKCLETKDPYLDLGYCFLTDKDFVTGSPIDTALRKCHFVRTLILSNEWFDYDKRAWLFSVNQGHANYLTLYPPALSRLKELSVLICGGAKDNTWDIIDTEPFAALTQLTYLDMSWNKVREVKGLDRLTRLQSLILYCNRLKDIKGLEQLSNLQQLVILDNQITDVTPLRHFFLRE